MLNSQMRCHYKPGLMMEMFMSGDIRRRNMKKTVVVQLIRAGSKRLKSRDQYDMDLSVSL